ncbi:hypothetical protein BSL78_26507 [Apostichopus japonicus]|uniref:Uncharacterized protein n=1 Tax=Stichopus japonicus TaxID=307972 RepID=A0A2G8JLP3_STIJA|nr:hypothetical protein BSL78_26507 [Apostichopus japonicus]
MVVNSDIKLKMCPQNMFRQVMSSSIGEIYQGNSNKLLPVMLVKWKQWCYSLLLAGEGGGEGEETKQQLLPYIDVKYFAK